MNPAIYHQITLTCQVAINRQVTFNNGRHYHSLILLKPLYTKKNGPALFIVFGPRINAVKTMSSA
jgi:hypothetical protein